MHTGVRGHRVAKLERRPSQSKPKSGPSWPAFSTLSRRPLYVNVSPVIGTVKWDMLKCFPLTVVHNPLAAVALPREIFGGDQRIRSRRSGRRIRASSIDG